MKVIIKENERGFLFKNGKFIRMVMPGKINIYDFLGETITKAMITRQVVINNTEIKVLLQDKNFSESVTTVRVPDNSFAIHFEDGRAVECITAGTYYFWSVFKEHMFEIIDISEPEITQVEKNRMLMIPASFYTKIEVIEGEVGLLFFDGKYQKTLSSGSYYFWKNATKVTCQNIDLRTQQLDISSQEILTSDKVTLRLNFVCTYKITDAVKINNLLNDYKNQIYIVTQLAIREYVGQLKFDELLEQKESIAGIVLKKLKEKENSLYIEFVSAGLKDIILPGEIRNIMNTVLIAEKNAQANVISRREEVASTRSLLNTAKLMEENKTLYKLKELEYLEKICDRVGNISVGNGNLLNQLSEIVSSK